ncbi:MAG: FAD-dependent oxidoreductase, partial [Clostridiales bacterium]|nr:FAD-dependent oxidoreductase [Clostridiales bacterium]
MKLLVCIDDTDNLDSKGTGAIAEELQQLIGREGFGSCGFITRHQLLLHSDIPYTSHNSSMCFDCEIADGRYEELLPKLFEHLQKESASGSDPGIAVAIMDEMLDVQALLRFGMDAKRVVLIKEQAYENAARLGVWLREAGGTGQGVIGALAGIGLRLGGNDGEVKGAIEEFLEGETYSVEQLMQIRGLQAVCDEKLNDLPGTDLVCISWKAKPLLAHGRMILMVASTEEPHLWRTMKKDDMRRFGDERVFREGCESFLPDVAEEQVEGGDRSCLNCRYRRWTEEGFLCSIVEPKENTKPQKFDVVVIGAGVIGGFVARHLMKTKLSLAILEKNSDVCCEATRANTAIIHSGYSAKP